ncbi:hypothetical protein Tco_0170878, partial [Tanacetum coccineum]
ALINAVTTTLPSPPLPPSLHIPPPIDHRDDIPKPTRGRGIDYGFVSTVDAEARRHGIREVNTRVTELAELHERDTQDLYALLEDAQDDSMDGGRGGLCFPRDLGSLHRIESGDPSRARHPPPYARIPDHHDASGDADSHV